MASALALADSSNEVGRSTVKSNPRRPAWENGQCFVFSNITAHGVDSGMENANKTRVRFGWRANGGVFEGAGAGAIFATLGLRRDLLTARLAARRMVANKSGSS